MGSQAHWDAIYQSKGDKELSWTEEQPATSLRLLTTHCDPSAGVLDVGGGRSDLAQALFDAGFARISVLDLSAAALEAQPSPPISRLVGDVLEVDLPTSIGTWHDRAVFHFLIDPLDQQRYVERAASSVASGGFVILGCFGPEGPEACSGLPVARHDASELAALFSESFDLQATEMETHTTPWGAEQQFCWVVLRRH